MGNIKIECPWCSQHYSVDVSFIGQNVECSICGNSFTVGTKNVISWADEQQEPHSSQAQQTLQQYCQTPQPPQYAQTSPQYRQPPMQNGGVPVVESDKSRNTFALLGFFLGCLGFHSFYLGKTGNGIATILANFLCSPPVVIFFVGIELLNTTTDSQNLPLQDKDSPVPLVLGILMILGGIFLFFITIPFYLASASNN